MNRTPSLKVLCVLTVALSLILALLPLSSAAQTPPAGDYKLTILHTNDTHAHILPFDKSYATCKPDTECWGGVARRAGLALAFKLVLNAERHWHKLAAPHLIALVGAGVKFQDGRQITQEQGTAHANPERTAA